MSSPLFCRRLPDDADRIARHVSICANQWYLLTDRLGNEQTVKRISVNRRQICHGKDVTEPNGQPPGVQAFYPLLQKRVDRQRESQLLSPSADTQNRPLMDT